MYSFKAKNYLFQVQTRNRKDIKPFYKVSYGIAVAGEVHPIAERIIKPCIVGVAGYKAGKEGQCPFSKTKTCQIADFTAT